MKFGTPDKIDDLELPEGNAPGQNRASELVPVAVGLGLWNRSKVKSFFPRGTTDELAYYSTQFNSVELNATFLRIFPAKQIRDWFERTAPHFMFVPKVPYEISHVLRLTEFEDITGKFVESISNFGNKLGSVFLQCPEDFGPDNLDPLQAFIGHWKQYGIPLAVEVRNAEWHQTPSVEGYYQYLQDQNVQNIILDTAGRRDLLHMQLTAPIPFIRFVGCNVDEIDYKRLDDWARRITKWQDEGLRGLYFFLHQNEEKQSAKLARYFILKLNELGVSDLEPPDVLNLPMPGLEG